MKFVAYAFATTLLFVSLLFLVFKIHFCFEFNKLKKETDIFIVSFIFVYFMLVCMLLSMASLLKIVYILKIYTKLLFPNILFS